MLNGIKLTKMNHWREDKRSRPHTLLLFSARHVDRIKKLKHVFKNNTEEYVLDKN